MKTASLILNSYLKCKYIGTPYPSAISDTPLELICILSPAEWKACVLAFHWVEDAQGKKDTPLVICSATEGDSDETNKDIGKEGILYAQSSVV